MTPVFTSRSAVLAVTLVLTVPVPAVRAQESPIMLAPHRAVYDLALGRTRSNSQIAGVRGRILYDFGGNSCDGYSLQFRQVSEVDSGEGKVSTSDLRSTTWEGGDAKSFRFNSENFLNQNLVDTVDGHAEHSTGATAVSLVKPKERALDFDPSVVFPTQHMVRVIEAAHAEKTLLDFPVYDGSDSGDKVYNTLTVIGHKLGPDERKHADALDDEPKLAAVARWPVTISYFDKSKKAKSGEETPVYAITFELYENGISRALSLDYGDFVVSGTMSQLELKNTPACK